CPECEGVSRRNFLRTAAGVIAASGAAGIGLPGVARGALASAAPLAEERKPAETLVKALYESLKPEQKKLVHFPFDHELRSFISNNWHVVDEKEGAIGKLYTSDQKALIHEIFKGVTSEEGHEKFLKQMQDDAGGFDNYTCAIFGEPGTGKFEWVMTGRHLTIRADGDSVENTAFGGPIFYGHAVEFTEKPDHPGNIWWHQARMANDIFKSLDGKQRDKALLEAAPPDEETTVRLRGPHGEIPGIPAGELGADQKAQLEKTLKSMLSMYRPKDVEEAFTCIKANGGLDALRLSFYKEGDLGSDGIWDRWRVEGPTVVWYFRGSPHVHAWVNIAQSATVRPAGRAVRL
ncbi:MAG TPA: DUF3500 domain-containing protein, partial [Planctomycetota bacterium]|nr:DUF3500 domain-containing protein [Planctomycetota bacterium]